MQYIIVCVVTEWHNNTNSLRRGVRDFKTNTHKTKFADGTEFINHEFKGHTKIYNVDARYAHAGDHSKLGIVDRIMQTLRHEEI